MTTIKTSLSHLFAVVLLVFMSQVPIQSYALEEAPRHERHVQTPEWAINATIYEVNVRQFSPEGTFAAFAKDLPRLKEIGVKILWIMPIHPIGEKNRKGTLGSYYAAQDYYEVNPEFGTKEDLKDLIRQIHELDMKVILDFVVNHTAWDHVWTETNPEYYARDEDGNFYPPDPDWDDVIQLDLDNPDVREAIIEVMEYWVREFDFDGYRADVAHMVPVDFWNTVRARLDEIKPVFMLAEAEIPELHEHAFDMSYAWEYAHIIRQIGASEKGLSDLDDHMERRFQKFARSDYLMYFTTNHDENSWHGSDPDMYGENFENFVVLSATIDGMPLVYNGQESGLDKMLEFFEKDPIEWKDYKYQDFYRTLLSLNINNTALWNGEHGGEFVKVPTDKDEVVYAYRRVNPDAQVFVILNFSEQEETITFEEPQDGEWTNVFTGETVTVGEGIILPAHQYLVLED